MNKKILFLADTRNIHTVRWAKKAAEWGYDVTVCSMFNAVIPGARVIYWKRRVTLFGKLDYLFFYFSLRKLLKKSSFDIVHAHYASSYGFIGALVRPKNLLISVWGSDIYLFPKRSFLHRWIIVFTLKMAHRICSTSKAMEREIARYTKKKVYLTPFGVDTSEYTPVADNQLIKPVVIGTVKRLETVYGIDTLLSAFALLKERGFRDISLVIAGAGSEEKRLRAYAEDRGIQDEVNFTGALPQEKVRAMLHSFDIFTALSRSESFGVAVLEASSCQIPVVTSSVGGLPEVVVNDVTGFLVEPDDPIAAADAIERLIKDPELRKQLGVNGRNFVRENYEWNRVAETMHRLYDSLYGHEDISRVLIWRSGLLGDTLVAVPSLKAIRENFPRAEITFVWQKTGTEGHVDPVQILEGTGLIDEFVVDELSASKLYRIKNYIKLWNRIRQCRPGLAIILEAPYWGSRQREWFLKLCGVGRIITPHVPSLEKLSNRIVLDAHGRVKRLPHISDQLLFVLREAGLKVPREGEADPRLFLGASKYKSITKWIENVDEKYTLLGIGLWSNMPSKRWPVERYIAVLQSLHKTHKVIPIFFGGANDRAVAESAYERLGFGINVAGLLTIQEGIALLSYTNGYLGNDTGILHMAVAAGLSCIGLFSATDAPGLWEPYGTGHTVLRKEIDCAGCLLRVCSARANECLTSLSVDEVRQAAERLLDDKHKVKNLSVQN